MSETPVPEDLATVATRLTETATAWRHEASELRKALNEQGNYGKRNRRAIYGLVISLMLDVILSVVVAVLAVKTADANSAARVNHQSQVAGCKATNTSRADNELLWDFFLQLSVPDESKLPAAEKAKLHALQAKIVQTYAQRDCDNLGPNGAPTITPSPTAS